MPIFRDAVLQQRPSLLDTLLRKSNESDPGYHKYSSTCIALISSPLKITNPASYPAFLSKLLQKAVDILSAETIKPVYQIVSSLSARDLDDLPVQVLLQLQNSLIVVLRSLDSADVSTSLFSLAVMSRLAATAISTSTPTSIDGNSSTVGQTLLPARQFFTAKRIHKTLDLVVLKAIVLCSRGCTLKTGEVVKSVSLCSEIVQAAPSSEIKSWISENAGKVKKLHEKVLRSDIDREIQWVALGFFSNLFEGQALPPEIVRAIEKFLIKLWMHSLDQITLSTHFCHLENNSIGSIACSLVERACKVPSQTIDSLIELQNAVNITTFLAAWIKKSPDVGNTISQAMSCGEGHALLLEFIGQAPMPTITRQYECTNPCPCAFQEAQARLQEELKVFLLSSALHSSQWEDNAFQLALLPLLEIASGTTWTVTPCASMSDRVRSAPVSLFEARSTPQSTSVSHRWKENVAKELSRDVYHRSESVIRMMGEICRDLERRCEEAECPLREDQSRSRHLEAKLEASEIKVCEFEASVQQSAFQIQNLEREKASLQAQVRSLESRLHDLSSSLDESHEGFRRAKAEAQRLADAAAEVARQQDLAYFATLAGKDEMYDEQALKLVASERRVQDLEEKLASLDTQGVEMAEKAHADDAIIGDLKKNLLELEAVVASKGAEVKRLNETEITLRATISRITEIAERVPTKHEETVAEFKAQLLAADAVTFRLREEHRNEIATMQAASSRLEDEVQLKVGNVQAEMQTLRHEATHILQERESTIGELQNRVASLRQERQARAREFAHAQDLSSKLMAMFGRQSSSVSSAKKANISGNDDVVSESVDGVAGEDFPDSKHARSFTHAASSDHGSPTPKRTRIQRSMTSPFTLSSKVPELSAVTGKPRTTMTNRLPLTPLGEPGTWPNWKSMASRQSKSPKKKFTPHDQAPGGIDDNVQTGQLLESDKSFEDADVFTSTNQQHFLALQSSAPSSTYDEITTDF